MRGAQRTGLALAIGALAGLAMLALDCLLSYAMVESFRVNEVLVAVLWHGAAGAVAGPLATLGLTWLRAAHPRPSHVGTVAFAFLYAAPLSTKVYALVGGRFGAPTAAAAAAAAAFLGYVAWIAVLRWVGGSRSRTLAPALAGLTVATGIALNHNLQGDPLAPTAFAIDGGLIIVSLTLAVLVRVGGPRIALAATLCLLLAPLASRIASPGEDGPTSVLRPHAGEKNVVLVVIDTQRKDVFDSVMQETPEGKALAQRLQGSARFTNAIAAAPWTPPSMGSILTGEYPVEHGFGVVPHGEDTAYQRLRDGSTTLAERLRAEGYAAGALVSNALLHPRTGIGRGFEPYHFVVDDRQRLPLLRFLANLRGAKTTSYVPADVLRTELDAVLDPLTKLDGPVFLWIHLMDPHLPLHPHPELPPVLEGEPRDRRELLYRNEVRFAFREVDRILKDVGERLSWERTALVLTSDHGEMFPSDEHDVGVQRLSGKGPKLYGHGHARYDELTRIPLVVRPAGGLPKDRTIEALVSHVDLPRTILALAGIDRPEGGPFAHGVSAASLLGSQAPEPGEGLVTSRSYPELRTARPVSGASGACTGSSFTTPIESGWWSSTT